MKDKIMKTINIKSIAWIPKTQHASLIPVIIINEIFGLRVFELKGRLRYSWSIVYISICLILYITYFKIIMKKNHKNMLIFRKIGITLNSYIKIVVIMSFIIFGIINTERLKKFIARCEEIDNTLKSFGIKKNYKKTFHFITQYLIIWSILMLSTFGLNWFWFTYQKKFDIVQAFNLSVLTYLPIIITCLGIFTFIIFVSILQDKLHKINDVMKEICQLSNTNDINTNIDTKYKMQSHIAREFIIVLDYYNTKHFIQHFLQIIRHIHFEIFKLTCELNRSYTYQIFLDLIAQFTFLMGAFYTLYYEIISSMTKGLINKKIILAFLWIFIHSARIIFVNNHCNNFYHEIKITTQLLRELENCYMDNSIRDEIQQFLLQLFLHPLHFTVGASILNNRLSTLFFSIIATYLPILVQLTWSPSMMKFLFHTSND